MRNKLAGVEQGQKRVGIWIRVSTDDQARGESPANHEARARAYADAKGWKVVDVYHLEGVSGKSVSSHPEAKRMLADVERGRISGLVFSKLARLARNTRELLDLSDTFRANNADLISLQESIDTTTPAGRLFYTMIAAMAQWEREEIADRVSASIPMRAKRGTPIGGRPSFGYHLKDGKVVPHPGEASIRKLIYELFLEHRRKKTVMRILNDRGFRTRGGAKWSDTTISRLIQDPTAKGQYRVNYTTASATRPGWVEHKPQSEWVIHEVEPIVSVELWEQCNAILDGRKRGSKVGRKPVHLFSGVAACECGQKMYVPSRSPKYTCWTCQNRIPVGDLEAIYHDQLKGFLFSDDQVAEQLELADNIIGQKQEALRHCERERQSVQREMDQTFRLYQEGQISSTGFGARYRPLEEWAEQLDRQLPAEQAALDVLKINRLSSSQILSEARDLHGRWPSLGQDEKRGIVEAITEKIIVGADNVEIRLHYLPQAIQAPGDSGLSPGLPPDFPIQSIASQASEGRANKATQSTRLR
jgi:site-specific DNA recombinase